jgi:hypothetical protein
MSDLTLGLLYNSDARKEQKEGFHLLPSSLPTSAPAWLPPLYLTHQLNRRKKLLIFANGKEGDVGTKEDNDLSINVRPLLARLAVQANLSHLAA